MKTKIKTKNALCGLMSGLLLLAAGNTTVRASLTDLGGGMIYDDALDITWLQNANQGGSQNRANARSWAENLVFGGYDDWRLPNIDVNGDGGLFASVANPDNEFAWMFFHNLGGNFWDNKTGTQTSVDGITFTGITARYYTADTGNDNKYYVYVMSDGGQFFQSAGTAAYGTWAVRAGGAPPVPANTPPVAKAGLDQSIRAGATVHLDGSASFDDNTASASLAYSWTFASKPASSTATLTDANTATPSFVADKAGSYVVNLVVTDQASAASQPDSVIISSDNQAPTAVATVDYALAIVGTASHFSGTGSTDPEMDALTYSWAITAKPVGSTVTLVGAATASPTLTTDAEGTYELTLTVSDFLGAGTPATVDVVATTPVNYAEIQIVNASDAVGALLPGQVTTKGNQTALGNFLKSATKNLQKGKIANAIADLTSALERTDGCALRGRPDGNGNGMDWITDCAAQANAYALLTAAIAALQ